MVGRSVRNARQEYRAYRCKRDCRYLDRREDPPTPVPMLGARALIVKARPGLQTPVPSPEARKSHLFLPAEPHIDLAYTLIR